MTTKEVIAEVLNIKKFNYTLAPDEVFIKSIQALKVVETLYTLVDITGRSPPRTITMEQLKQVLDEYMGGDVE